MAIEKRYEHNSLFRPGPNQSLNACVGLNGGPRDFDDYGEGFLKSGDRLVSSIIEDDLYIDLLIYPVAFLYRHGIELHLKLLIRLASQFNSNKESHQKGHSLNDVWATFESEAKKTKLRFFNDIELSIAADIIDDINNIDPTGQVFRYPEDLKGNLHLQGLSHINIEVLKDGMNVLHNFFTTWRHSLADAIQYAAEEALLRN